MQQAKDRGTDPPLPPLDHATRLLPLLLDLGLAGSGGMGVSPVSWSEIAQWQRLTCTPLAPWEARALRQASFEYVAQLGKSTDPACPAPWSVAPTDDDRARVAGGLRQLFAARARKA